MLDDGSDFKTVVSESRGIGFILVSSNPMEKNYLDCLVRVKNFFFSFSLASVTIFSRLPIFTKLSHKKHLFTSLFLIVSCIFSFVASLNKNYEVENT